MACATGSVSALLLTILFCFFVGGDTGTHYAAAMNDVRALIEFKRSITSDPFSVLSDWNAAAAPNACNWTGISCSKRHPGRVVKIFLEDAMFRGSLSPHLSNLSFLQVLDIKNNTFFGKIPASLGSLPRLKDLNLCSNEFEDGIPYQLGNLSSLQFLMLCENNLSREIPQSLAKLQKLQKFNVFQNHLGGQAPSWLGTLDKLEFLELSENNIHGLIPAQLGNLSSLQHLSLAFNYLSGFIPCSLGNLYRLTEIFLDQNNLTGSIPYCLRNLSALTAISFCCNNLQRQLPSWMGSFNKLQVLSLFENSLTGNIPDSWQNLTQLQDLQLSDNRLSGTLPPPWLATFCSHVTHFNFASNYFHGVVGSILQALSNCSILTHLFINENSFTGKLPPNFGSSFPKLSILGLAGNFISGRIPQSVGNLSSIMLLILFDNLLDGTIPPQIANLQSLQAIYLERNKLQGQIPTEISLLNRSLACLRLFENRLSGSIPASVGKLVNLRRLSLGKNLLSGKIPWQMGNCLVLESLVLSANNLSGAIPPEVAGLKSIIFHFDLSANDFTGEVPPQISGLQMAQHINLSGNQLYGNIASYIDRWLDARQINLSFNHFSGNLSTALGSKLTQLQSMDLSGNNFTGPVPESLFNHSTLQFLNFSYNNFDGEVPCLHGLIKKLRLTRWSFVGNPNLCGRCFDLNACLVSLLQKQSSHINKSKIMKIMLSIVGGLLLLVVAVALFHLRRSRTSKGKIPRIGEIFLKISVRELQRATDNFSTSNLVGEGSHGKVYRGILSSGRVVAVKCFLPTNQVQTEKSFKKECRALGKLRHRNILKIITVVSSEELKVLVMPFLSNGNLHALLHGREDGRLAPLKLAIRLKILTELASGLGYLHHDSPFQVIHCDIKPENVLLDDDQTVKISDFGISHLMEDFDHPTSSSSFAMKGSVGYIAPEYGIGQRISVKGDVYSFGVVALEVITRLKPTHEMFSGNLTLPMWISMALQGKSGEERRETIKDIIKRADEGGGGIQMDEEEEISIVESILMLGLRCTCQNALMRPSMKEVELFLLSVGTKKSQEKRTVLKSGNLEEV